MQGLRWKKTLRIEVKATATSQPGDAAWSAHCIGGLVDDPSTMPRSPPIDIRAPRTAHVDAARCVALPQHLIHHDKPRTARARALGGHHFAAVATALIPMRQGTCSATAHRAQIGMDSGPSHPRPACGAWQIRTVVHLPLLRQPVYNSLAEVEPSGPG